MNQNNNHCEAYRALDQHLRKQCADIGAKIWPNHISYVRMGAFEHRDNIFAKLHVYGRGPAFDICSAHKDNHMDALYDLRRKLNLTWAEFRRNDRLDRARFAKKA